MNKRFSTLLTAGLLMVGALFSNANAQSGVTAVADPVKEFKGYYLLGDGTNGFLKGKEVTIEGAKFTTLAATGATAFAAGTDVTDDCLWLIEPQMTSGTAAGTTVTGFKFKNKETGAYLTLADGTALEPSTKPAVNVFTWITAFADEKFTNAATGAKIEMTTNGVVLASGAATSLAAKAGATTIKAFTVNDETAEADDLNSTRGSFSFDAAGLDDNFFNKNIKAVEVGAAITSAASWTNANQQIPAGIYLATAWGDLTDATITTYDQFAKCTFIAIDPNTSVGKDAAADLKAGKNLSFKTVKGSDFNFFTASGEEDQVSKSDEVSVMNACFDVQANNAYRDADGNYSYAVVSKAKIRFQPETAKIAQKESASAATINVVEIDEVKKLTATVGGTKGYVFTFGSNPISKVDRLLNTTGASIYNIRFESGNVSGEKGKYLAIGVPASAYALVAQGTAAADLNTPLYQFVISKVDTKTNEVTFTNRETAEKLTCVLDTTETSGVYRIAASSDEYQLVTVGNDGDYTYASAAGIVGKTISLIPATVDKMAGFAVRGENKDYVHLSFAKDATAAMKYAVVDDSHAFEAATDKEELGALFELVRSDEPVLMRYDYVMLDSKGDPKTVALKDTVAYYTYNLKLVETSGTPYYLKESSTTLSLDQATPTADHTFIIKENKDGSVSIVKTIAAAAKAVSIDGSDELAFAGTPYKNADADDMKCFLTAQSYGVSLPAEVSHVTLEAATVFNAFVGASGNNEAILFNKTAADEDVTLYLDTAAVNEVLPSFYISKGAKDSKTRLYMYNAADSADYVGGADSQNPYLWATGVNKVIFKPATLVNSDTLTTIVKGEEVNVAAEADADGTVAGLENFRYQIYKIDDSEDAYVVRCGDEFLKNVNGKLTLGAVTEAMKVFVTVQDAPTSNEGVEVSEMTVITGEGNVTIAGAAGKKVVISNILGQVVANTVLSSDNATIAAPQGVVVIAVEGEEAVKAIVK